MWSYWAPEVIHWNYITEMRDLDEFSDFGCQCILAGKYLQYEKKTVFCYCFVMYLGNLWAVTTL